MAAAALCLPEAWAQGVPPNVSRTPYRTPSFTRTSIATRTVRLTPSHDRSSASASPSLEQSPTRSTSDALQPGQLYVLEPRVSAPPRPGPPLVVPVDMDDLRRHTARRRVLLRATGFFIAPAEGPVAPCFNISAGAGATRHQLERFIALNEVVGRPQPARAGAVQDVSLQLGDLVDERDQPPYGGPPQLLNVTIDPACLHPAGVRVYPTTNVTLAVQPPSPPTTFAADTAFTLAAAALAFSVVGSAIHGGAPTAVAGLYGHVTALRAAQCNLRARDNTVPDGIARGVAVDDIVAHALPFVEVGGSSTLSVALGNTLVWAVLGLVQLAAVRVSAARETQTAGSAAAGLRAPAVLVPVLLAAQPGVWQACVTSLAHADGVGSRVGVALLALVNLAPLAACVAVCTQYFAARWYWYSDAARLVRAVDGAPSTAADASSVSGAATLRDDSPPAAFGERGGGTAGVVVKQSARALTHVSFRDVAQSHGAALVVPIPADADDDDASSGSDGGGFDPSNTVAFRAVPLHRRSDATSGGDVSQRYDRSASAQHATLSESMLGDHAARHGNNDETAGDDEEVEDVYDASPAEYFFLGLGFWADGVPLVPPSRVKGVLKDSAKLHDPLLTAGDASTWACHFTARFYTVYDAYGPDRAWFAALEVAYIVVVGGLWGWRPPLAACGPLSGTLLAVACVRGVLLVALWPLRTPHGAAWAIIIAAACITSNSFGVVYHTATPRPFWAETAASVVAGLGLVLCVAAAVALVCVAAAERSLQRDVRRVVKDANERITDVQRRRINTARLREVDAKAARLRSRSVRQEARRARLLAEQQAERKLTEALKAMVVKRESDAVIEQLTRNPLAQADAAYTPGAVASRRGRRNVQWDDDPSDPGVPARELQRRGAGRGAASTSSPVSFAEVHDVDEALAAFGLVPQKSHHHAAAAAEGDATSAADRFPQGSAGAAAARAVEAAAASFAEPDPLAPQLSRRQPVTAAAARGSLRDFDADFDAVAQSSHQL